MGYEIKRNLISASKASSLTKSDWVEYTLDRSSAYLIDSPFTPVGTLEFPNDVTLDSGSKPLCFTVLLTIKNLSVISVEINVALTAAVHHHTYMPCI